jgi:hypothetical protein
MTQTQETTPGPKESKTNSFLVNILTLKSDPIVLTSETRPEACQVGHALLLTSMATMAEAYHWTHASWATYCLDPGIRKEQREGSRERERVQRHGSHRKEVAATKDNNLRPHGQSLPPSPHEPDGELAPCSTGHLCNSQLHFYQNAATVACGCA